MNSFNPVNRPALLALTGAMILGLTTLSATAAQPVGSFANPAQMSTITVTASAEEISAAYAEANVPTLPTVSVRPSAAEIAAAFATESRPLPTLPVVKVTASEEERIAAAIDPTDRITVMSTIRVLPSAEDLAAANATASVADANDDSGSIINTVFEAARPHRLRLDMPYYSFGRVLTHAPKN
jgi:hypothetical protein